MDQLRIRRFISSFRGKHNGFNRQKQEEKSHLKLQRHGNMGKFRYPVVLFIASFVLLFVSFAMRIMHWQGGQLLTGSMFMVQAISIIWLIVLLLKQGKKL